MEILELELVKKQFEKHCAFSMGIQEIRQASPHYDRLWVTRELARVKEAYDLVVRYGAHLCGNQGFTITAARCC